MKLKGKEFSTRGSNKEYYELDDLDWLYSLLRKKCITDVAKDLGVPQNSIRWRVFKYFPEEWLNNIVRKRRYHKRRSTPRKQG